MSVREMERERLRERDEADEYRYEPTWTVRELDRDAQAPPLLMGGRIPLHNMTVFAGLAGVGKSTAVLDLVRRTLDGEPWPYDDGVRLHGRALIVSGEATDAEMAPRLVKMGAVNMPLIIEDRDHGVGPETVIEAAESLDDLSMIVIDPFESLAANYAGKGNVMWDGAIQRRMLAPLIDWASEGERALFVVNHWNAREGSTARTRQLGSKSLVNLARCSISLGTYQGGHWMAADKFNLGETPPAIQYRLNGGIEWLDEDHGVTADHIAMDRPTVEDRDEQARQWLLTLVSEYDPDNGITSAQIEKFRKEKRIGEKRLKEAKSHLVRDRKIVKQQGFGEEARWFHVGAKEGKR